MLRRARKRTRDSHELRCTRGGRPPEWYGAKNRLLARCSSLRTTSIRTTQMPVQHIPTTMSSSRARRLIVHGAGGDTSAMDRGTLSVNVAALCLATVTSCGGGGDHSSSKCSEIWVEGKTLPKNYDGCVEDNGDLAAAAIYDCDDGTSFTSWDDRFYGIMGGTIHAVHGEMAGSSVMRMPNLPAALVSSSTSSVDRIRSTSTSM